MPNAVAIWVWSCAYLNAAGWALSAMHQLNAGGYAVVLAIWSGALIFWRQKSGAQAFPTACGRKFRRRFRRPFPLAFLILASLAVLGGVIYPPNNYDALAYRLPRILHWLDAGQWHWIHTIFERVNTRACGIEWVSAPFISIFKTDRFLFLLNSVSFLFLPGLVFSLFTRLGVRPRVAWHWMWILPAAGGYLLQAGSIGNDLFGAVFVLAAMDFALRAKTSHSPRDFFTAIVAAGMMTACKLSNLTLMLPWALAMLPSARLGWRWPLKMAAAGALALTASVLPTAYENFRHCGDWTGMAAEQPGMIHAPVFKTSVNVAQAALQNFVPPVFPLADKWNRLMDEQLPPDLIARLDRTMEGAKCRLHVEQMQIEENAGLGPGVSLLLLAGMVAAFLASRKNSAAGDSTWLKCVRWSPFISLLALLAQSNLYPIARLLTPYYALLLPPLLAGAGHEKVVGKRWWRAAACAVFFIAAVPLVLSPARPLFPAETILSKLPHAPERAQTVYSVYRARNDAFAPAKKAFPPDLKILGLITSDDPETSLWRPFGSRRVVHVCPGDTAEDLKRQGVSYVLANPGLFGSRFPPSADWLKTMNAAVVEKIPLRLRAENDSGDWLLIQLQ